MKEDWIGADDEFPLYKYYKWVSVDADMNRLSNKFSNYVFVVFGKGELFIDNIWVKIYRNGRLIYMGNDITFNVRIRMPLGDRGLTNGQIDASTYDVKQYFPSKDRSFLSYFNMATHLSLLLGKTATSLGSMVAEAAIASQVLSAGITILNEMQQNLINFNKNKGKCKHLVDRISNIVSTMQKIPADTLNLQHVICVVDRIKASQNLVDEYIKRWRITKFFMSGDYLDKFTAVNQELSDCFYDFGINYQITNKRIKD